MALIISDPIYKTIEITEPVLVELVNAPAMQRLKGIDQNVTGKIIDIPWGNYSRFDHSIGVMQVIQILGGNLEEKIAGLLHDVSHTAFSHVMDFVFGRANEQDFHEEHIERIISSSTIPEILNKYGYSLARIIDHHNFSILEQPIPELCADRVDYALKTFQQALYYPPEQLQAFLDRLTLQNRKIVFLDSQTAYEFALLFLKADQEAWGGSAVANTGYHLFAEIVKAEYEQGQITLDDFFKTDQGFIDALSSKARAEIVNLKKLRIEEVGINDPYNFHLNAKIRYVDPGVKIKVGEAKKLSELNSGFKKEMESALARRKQGNYVKIIS